MTSIAAAAPDGTKPRHDPQASPQSAAADDDDGAMEEEWEEGSFLDIVDLAKLYLACGSVSRSWKKVNEPVLVLCCSHFWC